MNLESPWRPITPTEIDCVLASAFYPILVDQARRRETITYGDLIGEAKRRSPENETVQRVVPISVGRRLDVVRMFTNQDDLPDLTSIVVNASTQEVGAGYSALYDPAAKREEVFAFDWGEVSPKFELYVATSKAALPTRRTKLTKKQAAAVMFDYYSANRALLPKDISTKRATIINLLMSGSSAVDAFEEAIRELA